MGESAHALLDFIEIIKVYAHNAPLVQNLTKLKILVFVKDGIEYLMHLLINVLLKTTVQQIKFQELMVVFVLQIPSGTMVNAAHAQQTQNPMPVNQLVSVKMVSPSMPQPINAQPIVDYLKYGKTIDVNVLLVMLGGMVHADNAQKVLLPAQMIKHVSATQQMLSTLLTPTFV